MTPAITKIIQWPSIPALLAISLFTRFAATYEPAVNFAICLGAILLIQRAVRLRQYAWAAGFATVVVVFSPLWLVAKIFLLLGCACIIALAAMWSTFRIRPGRAAATVSMLALWLAIPPAGSAQTPDPIDWKAKLQFHAAATYEPTALAGFAAYAGILQALNSPREWGQGGAAYGERFASTVAWSGIHGALAFGLDSTLHQDPRYHRSGDTGFWRRAAHALRGTILTRTDTGGETLSTWRIGSAYGSAFLSNLWYPDRLNTTRLGFLQGTETLGFDFAGNLGAEFWPDVKRKVLRRK